MMIMWTYIMRILTRTSIRVPLCLGNKLIVGTLENPYESYGPKYTGAPGIRNTNSHI